MWLQDDVNEDFLCLILNNIESSVAEVKTMCDLEKSISS